MTLEEFKNLKVGDNFYYLGILTNNTKPQKVQKILQREKIIHTDITSYYRYDFDKIYLNEKEFKIAYIKRILFFHGNVDKYTKFIKENVEHFI